MPCTGGLSHHWCPLIAGCPLPHPLTQSHTHTPLRGLEEGGGGLQQSWVSMGNTGEASRAHTANGMPGTYNMGGSCMDPLQIYLVPCWVDWGVLAGMMEWRQGDGTPGTPPGTRGVHVLPWSQGYIRIAPSLAQSP